jgi:uncharacterized UPF0160 family protein
MRKFREHLNEQMKDPQFAEAFNKEKDFINELMATLTQKRIKRATKNANKEIRSIKLAEKKKKKNEL